MYCATRYRVLSVITLYNEHMQSDSKTTIDATPDLYAATSSTQRVFMELRDKIIQGEIAPGERLKVDSLKALLHAGATPIREALSLLTSDQLVERLDQRGFRAATASDKNFREILSLRCQLETIALTDSINRGSKEWEEQLVLSHHRLTQADLKLQQAKTDNTLSTTIQQMHRAREQLHKSFHIRLLQACDSPILLKFCDQLYDLNIRYRFLAGESVQYSSRDVSAEHTVILNAAIGKDTEAAAHALTNHYRQTGVFLVDQLKASGASIKSNSTSE